MAELKCDKCGRTNFKSKSGLTLHTKKCGQAKPRKLAEPKDMMELVIRSIQSKYDVGGRMEKLWGGRCLRVHYQFSKLAIWVSPYGQLRVLASLHLMDVLKRQPPYEDWHFVFGKEFEDLSDPEWDPEYLVDKAGDVIKEFRVDVDEVAKRLGCECKECERR
jgi:hypothetical protein